MTIARQASTVAWCGIGEPIRGGPGQRGQRRTFVVGLVVGCGHPSAEPRGWGAGEKIPNRYVWEADSRGGWAPLCPDPPGLSTVTPHPRISFLDLRHPLVCAARRCGTPTVAGRRHRCSSGGARAARTGYPVWRCMDTRRSTRVDNAPGRTGRCLPHQCAAAERGDMALDTMRRV